jgi:hypothetical protein
LIGLVAAIFSTGATAQVDGPRITTRDDAIALLALYAGNWTASGVSRGSLNGELVAATCNVEATFDAGTATLAHSGRCSNGQQSFRLRDGISINQSTELVVGFRPRAARQIDTHTGMYQGGFVVQAHYVADATETDIDATVSASRPRLIDGRVTFNLNVDLVHPGTGQTIQFSSMTFTRNN